MDTHYLRRLGDSLWAADLSGDGDGLALALGDLGHLGPCRLLDVTLPDLGAQLPFLFSTHQILCGPAKK